MRFFERLTRGFDLSRPEQAQAYVDSLRTSWNDVSRTLTRNSWIIVLLFAAYDLASRKAVSTVTVGPIAIVHFKYLTVFVPTIVSYLFYEQVLLAERWMESEATHRYLMHLLTPEIEKCDFDALLTPGLPGVANLMHTYSQTSITPSKVIRGISQYVLSLLLALAVPVFDIIALYQLGGAFGARSIVFWLNVGLTAILVILAVAIFVFWLIEERLVW
jgi:hypothetical protein